MKRYYSYAGINICIEGSDEYMYKDDRLLKEFRCDELNDYHHYQFEIVDELSLPLGNLRATQSNIHEYISDKDIVRYVGIGKNGYKDAYMRVHHHDKEHYIQMLKSKSSYGIGTHIVYEVLQSDYLILEQEGILMHASFIEHNGKAILFTAPSGTGKSTQADLWVKHRNANIINGDRCAVRFIDNKAYACGVPFAGSSNISKNKTLELSCIVCLGQAPKTTIEILKGYKAFRYLWEGVGVNTWDKKHVEDVSSIVERLIDSVPIYKLDCTPDISAIEALEEKLYDQ